MEIQVGQVYEMYSMWGKSGKRREKIIKIQKSDYGEIVISTKVFPAWSNPIEFLFTRTYTPDTFKGRIFKDVSKTDKIII